MPVRNYYIAEFSKDLYQYKKVYVPIVKGGNTYNASLDPLKVTITVHEPTQGGTVSPRPGVYNIAPLETLTFNFSPQNNYKYYQKYTTGTLVGSSGFMFTVVSASESQISYKLTRGTNFGKAVSNFDLYPIFLCTASPSTPPNPPSQYPKATSEFNQKLTKVFYYWQLPNNGAEMFSGNMPIVNFPVNSRITLEAKYENLTDANKAYIGPFLYNAKFTWFIKKPDNSITETSVNSLSSKKGTGYAQAGFTASQCGGYSATVVLSGTLDGKNWYEIDRK
jgi:hypothetical protein